MNDYTGKVTIWFREDGEVVTQFNYQKKYEEFLRLYEEIKNTDNKLEFAYCTSLGMHISRIAIIRGLVPCTDIEYHFQNYAIFPDKDARLDFWPTGFCDIMDDILEELLYPNKGDEK